MMPASRPIPEKRPRRVWRRERPRGSLGYATLRVARGRVLLQTRKWYESPKWKTTDGFDPSLIADWNNDRYAVPALGPEMISNGTFSGGATGWSVTAGTQQVVNGELEVTGNGTGFATTLLNITLEIGKTYALTATARKGTANANVVVRPGFNNSISAINTASTTNVTGTLYFQAVRTSETIIAFINDGASTGTFYVDNISVREVMLGDVGPELLDNGDFAAGGVADLALGWVLKTPAVGTETMTISGGVLNLTGDGTNAAWADQSFTTEIGATYTIIVQGANAQSGNISVGNTQGNASLINATIAASSWNAFSFVATATTTFIRLQKTSAALMTIDNVSVRKWTSRPTLRSATFAEMFTFTATSDVARTYIDASGVMRNDLAANQPRFTWQNGKRQLLLENQSQNILLNSATLSTQSVSVSTTAYTLSFYGTGTITLSGASTAGPLAGTGAGSRVSLTFTPSAGTLTLTVSGTVTNAQLEAQSVATSYIPTSGSAVARAIETCQFSALALAVIGRPAISGAVQAQGYRAGTSAGDAPVYWGNNLGACFASSRLATSARISDGANVRDVTPLVGYPTVPFRQSFAMNHSGAVIAAGGALSSIATTITPASMTRTLSYLGRAQTTSGPVPGDGFYDNAVLYTARVSDAATQALGVVLS